MRRVCWLLIAAVVTGWGAAGTVAAQDVPVTGLTRQALEGAPALDLVEPLELFRRTGPDSTARIQGMDVAETGEVHLFDVSRKEVRVLDGEGMTVRTIPVPVPRPVEVTFARDTVLALTLMPPSRSGRITHLHVIEAGGATEPRTDTLPVEFTGAPFRIRPTRSAWIFFHPVMEHPPEARDEPLADSLILAELDPVSLEMRRKVAFPLDRPRYAVTPNWSLYEVMALQPTNDVALDGRIYANVEGGYVIGVHGPDGTLERRIVGEVDRVPYTEEEFRAGLDARIRSEREKARERDCGGCDEYADLLERHGPRVGHADTRPVLGRIVASPGGRFLVRRLDLEEAPDAPIEPSARSGPDRTAIWDLVDVEDGVLGRLRTPPGADVTHFAWPHVYVEFGEVLDHARVRFRIAGVEGG